MIINITDLSKAALDEMFKNYSSNDLNKELYFRIYLKEIA